MQFLLLRGQQVEIKHRRRFRHFHRRGNFHRRIIRRPVVPNRVPVTPRPECRIGIAPDRRLRAREPAEPPRARFTAAGLTENAGVSHRRALAERAVRAERAEEFRVQWWGHRRRRNRRWSSPGELFLWMRGRGRRLLERRGWRRAYGRNSHDSGFIRHAHRGL